VSRKLALLATALVAAALFAAPQAMASRSLQIGLFDDPEVLGNPDRAFPTLRTLRVQMVRATLWWGGREGVAPRRPERPADPADPAYDWAVYDNAVRIAAENRIKVLFSITGTPRWASGSSAWNRAPRRMLDLRNFAYAAARRYSGTFVPEGAEEPLPAVRHWLVWNEPNNPVFLRPQFRRVRGRWRPQSAISYAQMCTAVWSGVHATLIRNEKVACGGTAPRGNNRAGRPRGSISPLNFLRAFRAAGARRFDAYAHHPYYGRPTETPTKKPNPRDKNTVRLGNIGVLIKELTRLYGRKRLWITEYGYQTRPPDRLFGVSWAKQALYLRQAYTIARRNPRIDMLLWFLLRDEPRLRGRDGWQSGLLTRSGRRKPAFRTFQRLRR
jgi:hypothetical protein